MAGITLRTARQVVPMIYAYTTPEIARHNGWTKIGYTEQSVDKRLKQQTHTADVLFHEEWRGNAVYDDGSGEVFTDHDFHAYLRKLNVENDRKNEWFHLDGQQSRRYFQDFRMNRGRCSWMPPSPTPCGKNRQGLSATPRPITRATPAENTSGTPRPRFGKTLSVYDFCKQVDAQTVLIVTNRPAIANSWCSDYVRFLGMESGYLFVSHVDALAGQPHVLDEQGYLDAAAQGEKLYKRIEFVSLQDMKGSKYFGGEYDKLRHLTELNWDVLVIDEAHEGVDTSQDRPSL
ncbi:MAG: GIY-YIG nuclease family protein [Faecalibacterium prausnitzii]